MTRNEVIELIQQYKDDGFKILDLELKNGSVIVLDIDNHKISYYTEFIEIYCNLIEKTIYWSPRFNYSAIKSISV